MIEDAVVILGDVCGSRKMKMDKRYEGQLYLKSGIIQLNESFYNLIEAPFMITRGDEFQGILKNLKSAVEIMLEFERLLFPLDLRYGIGLGNVHPMGSKKTIEMDGDAFHKAREALLLSKKNKKNVTCNTGEIKTDLLINAIFSLMYAIKNRWNKNNYERYWKYKKLGTFEKVARSENVSPQAIWDSMHNMRIKDVIEAEEKLISYFS